MPAMLRLLSVARSYPLLTRPQEDVVESCRLQCLAQRLLTTFREAVTVGLEGTMLSAAPTGEAYVGPHFCFLT